MFHASLAFSKYETLRDTALLSLYTGHTSITGHFTTRVSICRNRIAHARRLAICHYILGVATQILLKHSLNHSTRPCTHFVSVNSRFLRMLHSLQTVSQHSPIPTLIVLDFPTHSSLGNKILNNASSSSCI
jgi:hypothetical protein